MLELQTRALSVLEAYDIASREDRAQRLVWLSQFTVPGAVLGRSEPPALVEEARVCFINGLYIAALLTALACIDQCLTEILEERGVTPPRGIADAIKAAKKHGALAGQVVVDLERITELRHTFAHKKDTAHTLHARVKSTKTHPRVLLRGDAELAIRSMYSIYNASIRPL